MNSELEMTLEEAVAEFYGSLIGQDLQFIPERDKFQIAVRMLNKALRAIAREHEWAYYASTRNLGNPVAGERSIALPSSLRPRIINDDAVRLVNPTTGNAIRWAYFQPREAIHKYPADSQLYAAVMATSLQFSRPFYESEEVLEIHVPVMREPEMFRLPEQPTDPEEPLVTVPQEILDQPVDFDHPDLVVAKAIFFYAQTHPILQPRVMQLEDDFKTILYALQERNDRHTAAPFVNNWDMGIYGSIADGHSYHQSPHTKGQW